MCLYMCICRFVVGYCLDFNEVYRDLKHLAVINEYGYNKFKNFEFPSDTSDL